MEHLEILLPITILTLAFGLKLLIDRTIDIVSVLQALCELPVDIIFLSISFLGAFTISKPEDPNDGLFYTVAFIVCSLFIVFLWRRSLKLFDARNNWWIVLLITNLTISIFLLDLSINTLLKEETKTENIKSKTEENGHQ